MKLIYIAFVIANILDLITTQIGLKIGYKLYGDFFGESNPYMQDITTWYGTLYKLAVPLILIFIYVQLIKAYDVKQVRIAVAVFLLIGVMVFTIASIHNINQIIYMMKS